MEKRTAVVFPWTCVVYQAFPAKQQTKTTASLEEQVLVEFREPGKAHHQLSCRLHHYILGAHPAEHAVQQMLISLLYQDDFCAIRYQDKKTWVFWNVYLMSVGVWDEPGKKGLGWEVVFSPSELSRGRERVAGWTTARGQPTTVCYWQTKGSSRPRNYSKCRFTFSCALLNPEISTPIRLSVHWPCNFSLNSPPLLIAK